MIMVLRRWFIPSDKLEEFREKWRNEIKPQLQRQPGCIRIEVYESSIRGHWVTSVLWQDEDSRMRALQELSGLYNAFRQYERFEAEVLTLRPEQ
jgi:heme-degrading monooxygenase HmoA